MGLDAVVFRNSESLRRLFNVLAIARDEATGELEIPEDRVASVPPDARFAISLRLGNVSEIGRLRAIVERASLQRDSLLLQKVLASGTHSGDRIDQHELQQLGAELDFLRPLVPREAEEFLEQMDSLVNAACLESNPIVFV